MCEKRCAAYVNNIVVNLIKVQHRQNNGQQSKLETVFFETAFLRSDNIFLARHLLPGYAK